MKDQAKDQDRDQVGDQVRYQVRPGYQGTDQVWYHGKDQLNDKLNT